MLNAYGFLAKIFDILAKHRLSIDLVTTSEVSVALTVDGTSLGSANRSILENEMLLSQLRDLGEVKIEENLTLVALIGNALTRTPGIAARAFEAISDFNMRLICHGASSHNLCFLVNSEEALPVVRQLHRVFIEEQA
jgi:aspartate kinase